MTNGSAPFSQCCRWAPAPYERLGLPLMPVLMTFRQARKDRRQRRRGRPQALVRLERLTNAVSDGTAAASASSKGQRAAVTASKRETQAGRWRSARPLALAALPLARPAQLKWRQAQSPVTEPADPGVARKS